MRVVEAKKWAYGILGRLIHRVFAEDFATAFAPEIFEAYTFQGTTLCFSALGCIATAFIATLTPYL
ncbi:hypothetical protein P692DRAFT_20836884, partial [Suillus brevipes Sb2]